MNQIGRSFAERSSAAPSARPLLTGLAVLAAFDFLAPDMLEELASRRRDFLMLGVMGAVAGQMLLLSVWAVLGPSGFWRRWPAVLMAMGCLYAAFLAGMAAAHVLPADQQVFAVNLFFLPLLFLCAQAPLWLFRLVLGRGLALEDEPRPRDAGVQFLMRDILTALALIGVALGLARLAVLLHEMHNRRHEAFDPWLNLALACAVFAAWGALGTLPCVWAAFLTVRRAAACLAVAAYAFFAVFAVSAGLAVAVKLTPFWEACGAFLAFHAGLLAVLLVGCSLLRGRGYTLR